MPVPIHVVDAFTEEPFTGNPAAVCLLERPAEVEWMRSVAAEMNLSETAFASPRSDGDHDLRWFTPTAEVDLCGHATLATAHVMGSTRRFHTRSGLLTCTPAAGGGITVDLPAAPVGPVDDADLDAWASAVGLPPDAVEALHGSPVGWTLLHLRSASDVRAARPRIAEVVALGGFVTVVADTTEEVGEPFDSVCRTFVPGAGIDEDPVTGAAHCVIAPWLAARTGLDTFVGHQASARGGTVAMAVRGDRVLLGGRAVTVASGALVVDPPPG